MAWNTQSRKNREESETTPILSIEEMMTRLNRHPVAIRSAVMTRAAKLPSVNTHQLNTMILHAQRAQRA